MRIFLYIFCLFSFAYAQIPDGLFFCRELKKLTPEDSQFKHLKATQYCLQHKLLTNVIGMDEIEYVGKEKLFAEVDELIDSFIKLYHETHRLCQQQNSKQCELFYRETYDSFLIKRVFIHSLVLVGADSTLKKWFSGELPYYDINRMLYPLKYEIPKARVSILELAAGHPYSSLEVLKFFFEKGLVDINSKENYPLHVSIINKKNDRFDFLMEQGYDINAYDKKHDAPYVWLSAEMKKEDKELKEKYEAGQTDVYEKRFAELLDEAWKKNIPVRSETVDQEGQTPLIRAIAYQNKHAFDALIQMNELEVNKVNLDKGESPLMIAAYHAFINKNPKQKDYFFTELLNHPEIDVNSMLKNRPGFGLVNQVATFMKDFGATYDDLYLLKDVVEHPHFDAKKHCPKNFPCLRSVILTCSPVVVETVKKLAPEVDFKSEIYVHQGVKYDVMGYVRKLKQTAPSVEIRDRLSKIEKILKKWKKQFSKKS